MKKTFVLFLNTLRRSRIILVVALVCGVGLCFLYSAMLGLVGGQYGSVPVGLLAHEETAVTRDFRHYLTQDLGMEVVEANEIEFLNTELVERHVAAVLEVPEGFEAGLLKGEPIPLQVSFLDDYANAAFVRGYLENYTSSLATLALGAEGSEARLEEMLETLQQSMVPVETEHTSSTSLIAVNQKNAFVQVMGFYLMFGFLLAFATALQLFDDRQNGQYNRIKASNVRTVQYLVGTCSVGLLNAVTLIGPFFLYLSIAKPDIGMKIWQAAALCMLYALFVMGFALTASLYLSSKNAITAGIVGASTIMCLLGGAYFPITSSPQFLQKLARATPQFWFVDAVNRLQENPEAAWWLNAAVIVLFAMLFFILAGIRFVQGGRKKHLA